MVDAREAKQSLSIRGRFARQFALRRARLQAALFRARAWLNRHRAVRVIFVGVLIALMMSVAIPHLVMVLVRFLATQDKIAGVQAVLVALGSALVGATVITFSFVMFALQVNVERMPYGLFQRLSSDAKLLWAFLIAFLLGISVLAASLPSDAITLAWSLTSAMLSTILIVGLVLYSYARALRLINPLQQLTLVLEHARRDLRRWARRASLAAPLLQEAGEPEKSAVMRSEIDLPRATFFQVNLHWTVDSKRAISHAIALARYYAERGDTEITGAALNTVVSINGSYIEAKDRTFFGTNFMFENPLSTDDFVNDTLEHLRQNVQIGVSRGDEQQIEQTCRAIGKLASVYSTIGYSTPEAPKHHARLALGYLSGAVKSVVPHNMPDVLMEGVRVMGSAAAHLMARDKEPTSAATAIQDIAAIGAAGLRNEDHRPVTQTAVEQLARLTLLALQTSEDRMCFTAKRASESVTALAQLFIQIPDNPMHPVASQCLQSYYSLSAEDALPTWLGKLSNAVLDAKSDDVNAQRVIRNIRQWSDRMYDSYRDMLQLAISKRSHFAFDILHGITHYASVLMALSRAPACDEWARKELVKQAEWLLYAITWVPNEKDSVSFAETFQIAELVFGSALEAERFQCPSIVTAARDVLLSWTVKAGQYETGWGTLERGLIASALLALRDPADDGKSLLDDIKKRLVQVKLTEAIRERTARALRIALEDYQDRAYALTHIDNELGRADRARLTDLLDRIADLLVEQSNAAPP